MVKDSSPQQVLELVLKIGYPCGLSDSDADFLFKNIDFYIAKPTNRLRCLINRALKKIPNYPAVSLLRRARWEPGYVKKKRVPKRIKNKAFYDSREWQDLRYRTLKTYGRKCMLCFATNTEMHVDHIKPRSKFPELALSLENLQVLCRACNKGKSNLDQTDWRPKQRP